LTLQEELEAEVKNILLLPHPWFEAKLLQFGMIFSNLIINKGAFQYWAVPRLRLFNTFINKAW